MPDGWSGTHITEVYNEKTFFRLVFGQDVHGYKFCCRIYSPYLHTVVIVHYYIRFFNE